MDKLTRQGVRDLDAKMGRIKPIKRENEPPDAFMCKHPAEARKKHFQSGDTTCLICDETL